MEDMQIVELYWTRDEAAIPETANKYGRYCHRIAYRILHDECDSEECVNDTYLHAWNSIPPRRPDPLSVFLGRATRNLALDRSDRERAQKRGGGEYPLVLDELDECVPDLRVPSDPTDELVIRYTLNRFLSELPVEKRRIFVRRYWYLDSIQEIAQEYHVSPSKVKMTLQRAREELKKMLAEGGIYV